MEMDRFPSRTWVVAHKPVAVAAGLGRMGLHRNVIHPRFGSFILLDTVITDAIVDDESRPLDYDPCIDCKLCVAACPVGAIAPDGRFDLSACYTHNYREFMGGFNDWIERIADSKDRLAYRERVTDAEGASMWQSLAFGPNYKAAYCMAVCPAGDDVLGPFVADRKGFLRRVVDPLQQKVEPVYVLAGSDAAAHVAKRFPHKLARDAGQPLRPTSIAGFLGAAPLVFQRGRAGDLAVRVRFTFTGREPMDATIAIAAGTISVQRGAPAADAPAPDVHVTVDADAWLGLLRRERRLGWAVLTRKLEVAGPIKMLRAFQRCFPG
jgi:ferredoxin